MVLLALGAQEDSNAFCYDLSVGVMGANQNLTMHPMGAQNHPYLDKAFRLHKAYSRLTL
jgi:hypothetical protein